MTPLSVNVEPLSRHTAVFLVTDTKAFAENAEVTQLTQREWAWRGMQLIRCSVIRSMRSETFARIKWRDSGADSGWVLALALSGRSHPFTSARQLADYMHHEDPSVLFKMWRRRSAMLANAGSLSDAIDAFILLTAIERKTGAVGWEHTLRRWALPPHARLKRLAWRVCGMDLREAAASRFLEAMRNVCTRVLEPLVACGNG